MTSGSPSFKVLTRTGSAPTENAVFGASTAVRNWFSKPGWMASSPAATPAQKRTGSLSLSSRCSQSDFKSSRPASQVATAIDLPAPAGALTKRQRPRLLDRSVEHCADTRPLHDEIGNGRWPELGHRQRRQVCERPRHETSEALTCQTVQRLAAGSPLVRTARGGAAPPTHDRGWSQSTAKESPHDHDPVNPTQPRPRGPLTVAIPARSPLGQIAGRRLAGRFRSPPGTWRRRHARCRRRGLRWRHRFLPTRAGGELPGVHRHHLRSDPQPHQTSTSANESAPRIAAESRS